MFEKLIGKTVAKIEGLVTGSDSVRFHFEDGTQLRLYHSYDCCETVQVEDITGDVDDLIGEKLWFADVSSNEDTSGTRESATWTFYRFATTKGWVTIRWLGESNGYYSEYVTEEIVEPTEKPPEPTDPEK